MLNPLRIRSDSGEPKLLAETLKPFLRVGVISSLLTPFIRSSAIRGLILPLLQPSLKIRSCLISQEKIILIFIIEFQDALSLLLMDSPLTTLSPFNTESKFVSKHVMLHSNPPKARFDCQKSKVLQ